MKFPEREIETCWPRVSPDDLKVGETYYETVYYDEDLRIPEVRPLILLEISTHDGQRVFTFQAASTYYNDWDRSDFVDPGQDDWFSRWIINYAETGLSCILTFDQMLNVLLVCSLRRDGVDTWNTD